MINVEWLGTSGLVTTYIWNLKCFVWGKKILGQPGILIRTCQLFDSLRIRECYLFGNEIFMHHL